MSVQIADVCDRTKPRNIVIPIDGSGHSRHAFEWYNKYVKRPDDRITFVNVVDPIFNLPQVELYFELPITVDLKKLLEENIEFGKKMCEQYMKMASGTKSPLEAIVLAHNRPGQAIVNVVNQRKAELVVMGNRGLGALRRTFLGSVSEYVLHHAQTNALIAPLEQQADDEY